MRRLRLPVLFCLVWVVAGCKPPAQSQTASNPGGSASGDASAAKSSPAGNTAGGDDFVMRVQLNKVSGEEERTAFSDTFKQPAPDLIAEKVKSLNWQSAPDRPFVSLARKVNGTVQSMRLQGTLKTANQDGLLRLSWYGVKNGAMKYIQTPPLDSADAAIPVLVSYAQNDGKWRTMMTWEDAAPAGDGQ